MGQAKEENRSFICVHGQFGKYAIDNMQGETVEAYVDKSTMDALSKELAKIQLQNAGMAVTHGSVAKVSDDIIANGVVKESSLPYIRRAAMMLMQKEDINKNDVDEIFKITSAASNKKRDLYWIY